MEQAVGVRQCSGQRAIEPDLDIWLAEAWTCGVRAVETFATGLHYDGAAARASFTTLWDNRQAEGQLTKLKMINR